MACIRIGFDARLAGIAQGGIGRYAEHVIRGLARRENDFSVTLFLRKENWDLFDNLDDRFQRARADMPWYSVQEQVLLPLIFARAACDLYHVPHFNVPFAMPRPYVMTLHDLIMWEKGGERDTTRGLLAAYGKRMAMKAVVRRALIHCAVCVVPSQWSASRIEPVTGLTPTRAEVVYEGADALPNGSTDTLTELEDQYGIQTPFVLTVGNAYTHKNIPLVIDALASVRSQFSRLHHVHAGPTHPKVFYEALMKYGKEKLGEYFHHIGNVPDRTLAALYRHAEALIAASDMEGFALPALEAMREGCAVVAARAHCYPEILGDAVQYFASGDRAGLANAIKQLLLDQDARTRYARLGKAQAEKYTWRKHTEALYTIYQTIGTHTYAH